VLPVRRQQHEGSAFPGSHGAEISLIYGENAVDVQAFGRCDPRRRQLVKIKVPVGRDQFVTARMSSLVRFSSVNAR
jgi:hypothetical protein